jgi:hypothetical protein
MKPKHGLSVFLGAALTTFLLWQALDMHREFNEITPGSTGNHETFRSISINLFRYFVLIQSEAPGELNMTMGLGGRCEHGIREETIINVNGGTFRMNNRKTASCLLQIE